MTDIRFATPDDAVSLADLRYEFRTSIGEPVEVRDEFVSRCAAWMRDRLAPDSPWKCWVALQDGTIVGHLWLYRMEKVPNPVPEAEWHAYITNVYVSPAHRGGVGTALMEAAMAFAEDNGADSAILWPTDGSRSLYERFGFGAADDVMEAIVTPGRDLNHQRSLYNESK